MSFELTAEAVFAVEETGIQVWLRKWVVPDLVILAEAGLFTDILGCTEIGAV